MTSVNDELHCIKCNKKLGIIIKGKGVKVMCNICHLKEASSLSIVSSDKELAEMRKHFANNPGVLKLLKEQEDRNKLKGGE